MSIVISHPPGSGPYTIHAHGVKIMLSAEEMLELQRLIPMALSPDQGWDAREQEPELFMREETVDEYA